MSRWLTAPTPSEMLQQRFPRSYLGDPAKFRLVHGGGEVFHSHHPHGGTIRWTRSPQREAQQLLNLTTAAYDGPVKYPVIRTTSDQSGCSGNWSIRSYGPGN